MNSPQPKLVEESILQPPPAGRSCAAGSSAASGELNDTIYTCPMHPQIRQAGPGACPICGMALEPEMVTAGEEENPELADMTRRFWIGVVLSVPVLFLGMTERLPFIQLLLATPVAVWAGWPLF